MRALGLDFGLSGVRATVVDSSTGLVASARAGDPVRAVGGRAEYDLPAAWEAMRAAITDLGEAAEGIDAIGLGALGATPLLADGIGTPLTPGLCFSLDTRADAERRAIDPGLSHDHALAKVVWLADRHPEAAWALDAVSWLGWQLTGVPAMDAITRLQYEHADVECPVPTPPSVDPLAVLGPLTAQIGLPGGTPVVAGTLDSYVDVVAAGCTRIGDGCVILGSTLVVYGVIARPVEVAGLEIQAYPGDGWLLGGSTSNGGNILAWMRSIAGDAAADDAGGVELLPYLAGERTPVRTPDAGGELTGLSLGTTGPQLVRAAIDALGLVVLDHADLILGATEVRQWTATGGGVLDPAWLQTTADAIGSPLRLAPLAGTGAGPAMFALRAIGADLDLPTPEGPAPDPAAHARLRAALDGYRRRTRALEEGP